MGPKSLAEIQRAHYSLSAIVTGAASELLSDTSRLAIKAQLSVLCWMLGHKAGCIFESNLKAVDRLMRVQDGTAAASERVH